MWDGFGMSPYFCLGFSKAGIKALVVALLLEEAEPWGSASSLGGDCRWPSSGTGSLSIDQTFIFVALWPRIEKSGEGHVDHDKATQAIDSSEFAGWEVLPDARSSNWNMINIEIG